jgi:hypothetical protein
MLFLAVLLGLTAGGLTACDGGDTVDTEDTDAA